MEEEISLERFKEKIGEYWFNSLLDLDEKYRRTVAESILIVAGGEDECGPSIGLATNSAKILELVGIDGYLDVVEGICRVKDERRTAEFLAWRSAKIVDVAGMEGYQAVVECLCRVKEKSSATHFLSSYADKILKIGGIKCYQIVVDSFERVVEEDENFAFILSSRSLKVIERLKGKDLAVDPFLIESILDQKDAQFMSQIIDMKKYQDTYNEKVERFY